MSVYRGKKPVADWSDQEVFDYVSDHLLTQKQKAQEYPDLGTASGGGCRYRMRYNDKRLSCAIGCLIPNRVYDKKIEGTVVKDIYDSMDDASIREWLGNNVARKELLEVLQDVHDYAIPSDWKYKLSKVQEWLTSGRKKKLPR